MPNFKFHISMLEQEEKRKKKNKKKPTNDLLAERSRGGERGKFLRIRE